MLAEARPLTVEFIGKSAALAAVVFVVGVINSGPSPTTNERGFEMPKRPTKRAS